MHPASSTKTYTTQVICLRTIQYGEADKILHLYSPDFGRISAIAKGVKKANSKLAGACEVLNLSEVQLSRGQNLHLLCQYQPLEGFPRLRGDILKLAYGLLFAELVNRVSTEHDMDSERIFACLQGGLQGLNTADDEAITAVATDFQLSLLHASGYQPDLTQCLSTGEPIDPTQPYYSFSATLGGIVRKDQMSLYPAATWVPVSTSTLAALSEPYGNAWQQANPLKVQKFLRYYYSQIFEHSSKAYDFVFQLLEQAEIQRDTPHPAR